VTVLEVLQSTARYFAERGVESPRLNIEHLLAEALGKKRIELYLEFDRQLTEVELAPLRERVRRRAAGEPLQHLIGNWDFWGRRFKTDGRALVPRPETETLAEIVLAAVSAADSKGKVLADVGTGTGVLAITFALEQPELRVLAFELSEDALSLAAENVATHAVVDRVSLIHSDLLAAARCPIDFLVANLPYIPTGTLTQLSPEVRHDPALALDGGPDGLKLVKRLLVEAPSMLQPDASIFLEVGHDQADTVAALCTEQKYRDISIKNDYQGVRRFVCARYG
jgi:release factor glutamine methyltransferase